jgi:hypothetical protein
MRSVVEGTMGQWDYITPHSELQCALGILPPMMDLLKFTPSFSDIDFYTKLPIEPMNFILLIE